jgi:hypothetical protein
MSVSCECCVLSCRGLCDVPITRPGESDRLWSRNLRGRYIPKRSVQPWEKECRAWYKDESTKKTRKTVCLLTARSSCSRCAGNNTTERPDKSWNLETRNLPLVMSLLGPVLKVKEEGAENTVMLGWNCTAAMTEDTDCVRTVCKFISHKSKRRQ